MYTVFLDESGTDGRSPIVMVGGYVSDTNGWKNFKIEWAEFLNDEALDIFHASDLDRIKGGNGLQVAMRAVSIINKHVMFGVLAYTDIAACESAIPRYDAETKEKRRLHSAEYGLSAMMALYHVLEWADEKGHTEPINFVFENDGPGKGDFLNTISDIRKSPSSRFRHLIGSVTLGLKTDWPELQSADALVYEGRRVLEDWLYNRISPEAITNWLKAARVQSLRWQDATSLAALVRKGREITVAKREFKQRQQAKHQKRIIKDI